MHLCTKLIIFFIRGLFSKSPRNIVYRTIIIVRYGNKSLSAPEKLSTIRVFGGREESRGKWWSCEDNTSESKHLFLFFFYFFQSYKRVVKFSSSILRERRESVKSARFIKLLGFFSLRFTLINMNTTLRSDFEKLRPNFISSRYCVELDNFFLEFRTFFFSMNSETSVVRPLLCSFFFPHYVL